MQQIRLIRLPCQKFAIHSLRLGEPPRLMVLHRLRDRSPNDRRLGMIRQLCHWGIVAAICRRTEAGT